MKKILVTGGAGFVGKSLVRALRHQGNDVRVLDIQPVDGVENIQGSILDTATVANAVRHIDVIYHLAGNAQLWSPKSDVFHKVNVDGTKMVLEHALKEKIERFVFCSSLTTLVGKHTPLGASLANEGNFIDPDDLLGAYPRSKRLAELAVNDAARKGLNTVTAIPTEPLGAEDYSMTPPTQMIADFLNGKTPASIDCSLNFVPVESLADGLIAVADRGEAGSRYVLGGEDISMRELLLALETIATRKMPKLQLPYWIALTAGIIDTGMSNVTGKMPKAPLTGVRLAGRRVSFSSDKACNELSWKASPFFPALEKAVKWLLQSGKVSI